MDHLEGEFRGYDGINLFYQCWLPDSEINKIYDGFYHEIFNEPGYEKVLEDMENWLETRIRTGIR
jgi:hypothetical protein